uniref:Uncharacterized protein n=1 Tax=Magallana gigas TaxID=29159 RepID=K1Q461_MAGGI
MQCKIFVNKSTLRKTGDCPSSTYEMCRALGGTLATFENSADISAIAFQLHGGQELSEHGLRSPLPVVRGELSLRGVLHLREAQRRVKRSWIRGGRIEGSDVINGSGDCVKPSQTYVNEL